MLQIKLVKGTSKGLLFNVFSDEGMYIKDVTTNKLYKKVMTYKLDTSNYEETDILIPVKEKKKSAETIKEE